MSQVPGRARSARELDRRPVVSTGHPVGATVPRGGRPHLRGGLQDGRPGHPRLRGGLWRLLPVPAVGGAGQPGPAAGVVAAGVGRHAAVAAGAATRPQGGPDELVAEGFAVDVGLAARVGEKEVVWTERRWLVRSRAYAQSQEAALERRLATATAAVLDLPTRKQGKKQLFHAELVRAAGAIVTREGVEGLLSCAARAVLTTRPKRAYGGRPGREETDVSFVIEVRREETLIREKKREMGWQVYGTNGLARVLAQVVWAYRGQYRIEDDWSRLKGRSLGLTPLYLQDEGRIQGLVYLLSLALRVLTVVEWEVRERLRQEGSSLQGVYAGQPGRRTARPSAELLLGAMKTISVSVVEVNGQTYALLSPLTEVQRRLLELWDMPPDLYENVARGFRKAPSNMSEP